MHELNLKALQNCSDDLMRAERRMSRTNAVAQSLSCELSDLLEEEKKIKQKISEKNMELVKVRVVIGQPFPDTLIKVSKEAAWLTARINDRRSRTLPALVFKVLQTGGWVDDSGH